MTFASQFHQKYLEITQINVKKMRGIRKKWFREAVEIVKGSKMILLGKNFPFFLIFSRFDMVLLVVCPLRTIIFDPFIWDNKYNNDMI